MSGSLGSRAQACDSIKEQLTALARACPVDPFWRFEWIAMCMYLLLSYIKFLSNTQPSLQPILRLLQINLFERRDLLEFLRGDPSEPPISPNQSALLFS